MPEKVKTPLCCTEGKGISDIDEKESGISVIGVNTEKYSVKIFSLFDSDENLDREKLDSLYTYYACYKLSIDNPSSDLQKEVQKQETDLMQMGITQEEVRYIQDNGIENFLKEKNIEPSINFSAQNNIFMPLPEKIIYKWIKVWTINEVTGPIYSGDKQKLVDYLTRYIIPEKLIIIFNKKDINQKQKDKIHEMMQKIITSI